MQVPLRLVASDGFELAREVGAPSAPPALHLSQAKRAGLDRLVKDGPPGRRSAAGRRPVLEQPVQTGDHLAVRRMVGSLRREGAERSQDDLGMVIRARPKSRPSNQAFGRRLYGL